MRHARQLGLVDQEKLRRARVAIAGMGGLGVPAAVYLALAGVGRLIIIDSDAVEESNLNRQFLYTEKDVGKKKVKVAAERLREMAPVEVEAREELDVSGAELVLDCLDNWESRKKVWEQAFGQGVPVVHGAADEWSGQVAVFMEEGDAAAFQGKREKGCRVVGAVTGLIGARMAIEALRILGGEGAPKVVAFDGKNFQEYPIQRRRYSHVLVRFSEIWTKSEVTRKKLERVLARNIEAQVGVSPEIKRGRLVLPKCNYHPLSRVFGVKSFSPALRVPLSRLEEEFEEFARAVKGRRFRVTVHRSWKGYGKTSQELQKELGAIAARHGKVSLRGFEVELGVEIHRDGAYLFTEKLEGPGGLPYGSEGRVLAMFSGGMDSPVAAWMVARRGAAVDALFLNPLGEGLESRVAGVFEPLKEWMPGARLFVVDIGEEVAQIREQVEEGFRQVVYKRFMYRVAGEVARRLGCEAVVTGESLGQVSSQTLRSISILEELGIPVLRPLIGMDKEEIIARAKELGTYGLSAGISEFCSIERHSNANPALEDVLREEGKLEFDFREISGRLREARQLDVKDLRPPAKGRFVVVRLWEGMPELEPGKKYVFVCQAGNSAYERAVEARRKGVEAYALSRKEAIKRGLLK